jgi:hypothetical protein
MAERKPSWDSQQLLHPLRRSLFLILALILARPAPNPIRALTTQAQPRIGAVESFFRPTDAAEAGIGFERIIFEWRYLQPNGPKDWDTTQVPDVWLNDARSAGRMVVGLIKNAPKWATGSKLLGATPKGVYLPVDDPQNTWAIFIRELTAYYGTKWGIHHWIIYNEPDIRPQNTKNFEFAGSVKDYYQMVKVAYKVAHATDPDAVIHLAGFTYWHDVLYNRHQYLERLLRVASTDPEAKNNHYFFDVLTVHVFAGTEWVWTITRLFRNLTARVRLSPPIWIDEMNVRVTQDNGYPVGGGDSPVTLQQQASFIIQGTALGLAAGADHVEIYKLYDNDQHDNYEAWGLVRADGTRRPGYFALKTAAAYFGSTVKATRYKNEYATLVMLAQPDRTVYVIWNNTYQPVHVRIKPSPGSSSAEWVSVIGQTQTVTPNQGAYDLYLSPCSAPCAIQGEPQILIQAGSAQSGWVQIDQASVPLKK